MIEVNPLLLTGAVIGTITALLIGPPLMCW